MTLAATGRNFVRTKANECDFAPNNPAASDDKTAKKSLHSRPRKAARRSHPRALGA